jgi:putative transposase
MPEYRRSIGPGCTFFFTVNTYRRQPLLTVQAVRHELRAGIRKTRNTKPFRIDAWVLLPDHLHCIWTLPEGDGDFSSRWAMIKRHVSQSCGVLATQRDDLNASRQNRRERSIWQRRFWERRIRDETDYRRHVDYIHWNPVKHGLVCAVVDWPYSTFHQFVRKGVYPK